MAYSAPTRPSAASLSSFAPLTSSQWEEESSSTSSPSPPHHDIHKKTRDIEGGIELGTSFTLSSIKEGKDKDNVDENNFSTPMKKTIPSPFSASLPPFPPPTISLPLKCQSDSEIYQQLLHIEAIVKGKEEQFIQQLKSLSSVSTSLSSPSSLSHSSSPLSVFSLSFSSLFSSSTLSSFLLYCRMISFLSPSSLFTLSRISKNYYFLSHPSYHIQKKNNNDSATPATHVFPSLSSLLYCQSSFTLSSANFPLSLFSSNTSSSLPTSPSSPSSSLTSSLSPSPLFPLSPHSPLSKDHFHSKYRYHIRFLLHHTIPTMLSFLHSVHFHLNFHHSSDSPTLIIDIVKVIGKLNFIEKLSLSHYSKPHHPHHHEYTKSFMMHFLPIVHYQWKEPHESTLLFPRLHSLCLDGFNLSVPSPNEVLITPTIYNSHKNIPKNAMTQSPPRKDLHDDEGKEHRHEEGRDDGPIIPASVPIHLSDHKNTSSPLSSSRVPSHSPLYPPSSIPIQSLLSPLPLSPPLSISFLLSSFFTLQRRKFTSLSFLHCLTNNEFIESLLVTNIPSNISQEGGREGKEEGDGGEVRNKDMESYEFYDNCFSSLHHFSLDCNNLSTDVILRLSVKLAAIFLSPISLHSPLLSLHLDGPSLHEDSLHCLLQILSLKSLMFTHCKSSWNDDVMGKVMRQYGIVVDSNISSGGTEDVSVVALKRQSSKSSTVTSSSNSLRRLTALSLGHPTLSTKHSLHSFPSLVTSLFPSPSSLSLSSFILHAPSDISYLISSFTNVRSLTIYHLMGFTLKSLLPLLSLPSLSALSITLSPLSEFVLSSAAIEQSRTFVHSVVTPASSSSALAIPSWRSISFPRIHSLYFDFDSGGRKSSHYHYVDTAAVRDDLTSSYQLSLRDRVEYINKNCIVEFPLLSSIFPNLRTLHVSSLSDIQLLHISNLLSLQSLSIDRGEKISFIGMKAARRMKKLRELRIKGRERGGVKGKEKEKEMMGKSNNGNDDGIDEQFDENGNLRPPSELLERAHSTPVQSPSSSPSSPTSFSSDSLLFDSLSSSSFPLLSLIEFTNFPSFWDGTHLSSLLLSSPSLRTIKLKGHKYLLTKHVMQWKIPETLQTMEIRIPLYLNGNENDNSKGGGVQDGDMSVDMMNFLSKQQLQSHHIEKLQERFNKTKFIVRYED